MLEMHPLLLNIVVLCGSRSDASITTFGDLRCNGLRIVKDCSVLAFHDQERINDMELVIG
jgi:hypothetical protein